MKVIACIKSKPARIKNKDYGGGKKVNDLRFTLTLTFEQGQPKKIHATVSYNKHCLESYKDNDDWNPQLGQQTVHTLCGVSLDAFQEAFDEYGSLLCEKLVNVDDDTFNPETGIAALETKKGIWFKTDTNNLKKPNFHCFPTVPAGNAGGPNTWSLTSENAASIIRLCRILWSIGDRTYDDSKIAKGNVGFAKEVQKLEAKIKDPKTKAESIEGMKQQVFKLEHALASTQIQLDEKKVATLNAQKLVKAQEDYDRVKHHPWFSGLLGPHWVASLKIRLKGMGVSIA